MVCSMMFREACLFPSPQDWVLSVSKGDVRWWWFPFTFDSPFFCTLQDGVAFSQFILCAL